MATDPLTIALVSAGSSILGSLLTILATPQLQHHFWKSQKRDEIRLNTINDFKRLTSKFVIGYASTTPALYKPTNDWFEDFATVTSDVKVLFSKETVAAFNTVDVLIGPNTPGLGPHGQGTIQSFIAASDVALRRMYAQVIPIPTKP